MGAVGPPRPPGASSPRRTLGAPPGREGSPDPSPGPRPLGGGAATEQGRRTAVGRASSPETETQDGRRIPARDVFVTGLKKAHAMENQALSIMQPQVERLEHHPEMKAMLRSHIAETETQIQRLDQILAGVGESASTLKDTAPSTVGGSASLGHAVAGDEVLKNAFANHAFENREIAACVSLITSARLGAETASVALLEQSLDEERRMAGWIAENLSAVTGTDIAPRAGGETVKV